MPEDQKPINTLVITGTGDGGVTRTVTGLTPEDQPNVRVHPMPWWLAVLSRAAYVYLNAFVAFIGVGATPAAEQIGLVAAGNVFAHAAELAVYPTVMALVGHAVLLLGKLNERAPRWLA